MQRADRFAARMKNQWPHPDHVSRFGREGLTSLELFERHLGSNTLQVASGNNLQRPVFFSTRVKVNPQGNAGF